MRNAKARSTIDDGHLTVSNHQMRRIQTRSQIVGINGEYAFSVIMGDHVRLLAKVPSIGSE